jgi:hypothetical protein
MLVSPGVEPGTTTGTGHLWGRMDTAASVPPHSPTDVVVPEIAAPGLRSVLTLVVVLSRWSPVVFLSVSGQRHGRAGENRCAVCHLSSSYSGPWWWPHDSMAWAGLPRSGGPPVDLVIVERGEREGR